MADADKELERLKAELIAQLERDLYLDPEEDEDDDEDIDDEIWMMISSEVSAKDDEIIAEDDDDEEDYKFMPTDLVGLSSEVTAKDYEFKPEAANSEVSAKNDEIVAKGDDKSSSENADGMEAHKVWKDVSPSSSTNSTNEFEIKETKGIKFKADLENYSQEPEMKEIEAVDDATVVDADKDEG